MDTHRSALEKKDSTTNCPAFLQNEMALDAFLARWKAGKLSKPEWTHTAHVAMAAYFAYDLAPEAAFQLARNGILHHNKSVGTANTEDHGYHETLTRFWSEQIGGFVRARKFTSRFAAAREAVAMFGNDRDRYKLFYSFDVPGDRRARREWVPPDRETPAK
jgi:hypothetical protein